MDFHTFADACATVDLVRLMWVASPLAEEANPALWMKGHDFNIPEGLVHRSRDTHWLLSWNEQANDFDVATLQDVLGAVDFPNPNIMQSTMQGSSMVRSTVCIKCPGA